VDQGEEQEGAGFYPRTGRHVLKTKAHAMPTKPKNDRFATERSHQNSQIAYDSAKAAGQSVILINGGAATAVLAFLSKDTGFEVASAVPWSLLGYAVGVAVGAGLLYSMFFSNLNWNVFWQERALLGEKNVAELELRSWIARYPVPLMVWAWDQYEDMILPKGSNGQLVGWPAPGSNEIALSWKLEDLTTHEKTAPPSPDWRSIYKDISFKTDAQVKSDASKSILEWRQQKRTLQVILTLWVLVIPAGYAIFEYFGPDWFAFLVLTYTLWNIGRAWLKLMGYGKPSAAEEEKATKDLKMRHYFYHCERNPDGFTKLKAENFKEEARARIEKEAADVAQGIPN
jgi:hypothetical protein